MQIKSIVNEWYHNNDVVMTESNKTLRAQDDN